MQHLLQTPKRTIPLCTGCSVSSAPMTPNTKCKYYSMLVNVILPILPLKEKDKFMANFARLADPHHSCGFEHSPSSAYCSGGQGSDSSPELKRDEPETVASPMRSLPINRKLEFTPSPTTSTPQTKCSSTGPCTHPPTTPTMSVCSPKHECPRCKTVKVTNYLRLCPDCVTSNAAILPGISMVECGHCSHRVLCQQSPSKDTYVVDTPVKEAQKGQKKFECGQCDTSPNCDLSALFKTPKSKPNVTENYNLAPLFKTPKSSKPVAENYNLAPLFKTPKSSKATVAESPNFDLSPLFKLDSTPAPNPTAPITSEARTDLMLQELPNAKARERSSSEDSLSLCSNHHSIKSLFERHFATHKKSPADKKVSFTTEENAVSQDQPLITFATPPPSHHSFSGSVISKTREGDNKIPESRIQDLLCRSVDKKQALSTVEKWFADKEAVAILTSFVNSVYEEQEQVLKDAMLNGDVEASCVKVSESSEAFESSVQSKSSPSKSSEPTKSSPSKSAQSKFSPSKAAQSKSSAPSKSSKQPCQKCLKCRKKIHAMERSCESNTIRKTNSMQSLSDFSEHLAPAIPAPEILINLPATPVKRRPTKRDISSSILVKVKIFESLPEGVFKALQSDPQSPQAKKAMKNLKLLGSAQVLSPVQLVAPPAATEDSTAGDNVDNESTVNSSAFNSCYSDEDTLLNCSQCR